MEYLLVFIGGGLGALSRYFLGRFVNESVSSCFPWGTFAVNALGCLAIGFAYGLFTSRSSPNSVRVFVITGFLGGFTTFSSFGLETVNLLRSAHYGEAAANACGSLAVGAAFVALGLGLAALIPGKSA